MSIRAFRQDLEKYYRIELAGKPATFQRKVHLWVHNFGLHCVAVYRLGQYASALYKRNKAVGFVPAIIHRILSYAIRFFHHVDIDAANIGPGLYIGHVGTIYIGRAKIGSNLSISFNVTIGIGRQTGRAGIPTIGDNVWIGPNSVISGSVRIGNNATVATGTILSRTIPDSALVGGNPGRILLRVYNNRRLFNLPEKQTLDDFVRPARTYDTSGPGGDQSGGAAHGSA